MNYSKFIVAASVLAISALPSPAAEGGATELWALEGFSVPESVAWDQSRGELYVSNIAGEPDERNGAGFISRVSPDGEMLEAEWVTGLDAPKGLALDGATLYVTDIDRLVAIDIESGEIADSWPGEAAQFLNDPAVDDQGRVFVSDMLANAIYVLDGETFSVWLQDEALQHPNGLKVDGGRLIVAAWGQDMQPDFSTQVPGHLISIDLDSQEISAVGSGEPIGNLDGLEPDGAGGWLATDWIAGGLLRIGSDGSAERLVDLDQGSADLGYIESEGIAVIPMMQNDRVVAYQIQRE